MMGKRLNWTCGTVLVIAAGAFTSGFVTAVHAHEPVGAPIGIGALGDGVRRIAFSDDGRRIVVGTPSNGNGSARINGYVEVYELRDDAWTQLGSTIQGEASDDRFGWTVAISGDGLVIAAGGPRNDDGGDLAGHVRVYAWAGNDWVQRGPDLDGQGDRVGFGGSVSLDADGGRLAVSDNSNSSEFISAGSVRVFDWDGDSWEPLGQPVFGEARLDSFGGGVVLSADGSRFAAASNINDFAGENAGYVRIFEWNGGTWMPLGDAIPGENPGDREGASIDLTASGNRLVTSAVLNSDAAPFAGQVRVFDWTGSAWQQAGQDIEGDVPFEQAGSRVAISADGGTLLLGTPRANTYCRDRGGWVEAYRLVGGAWRVFGETLIGPKDDSNRGFDVDLSATGFRAVFVEGEFTPGEGFRSSVLSLDLNGDLPSLPGIEAVADGYTTPGNQVLAVAAPGLLENDILDSPGALCLFLLTPVTRGEVTLGAGGGFSFTPEAEFCGTDRFSYRFSDGQSLSNVTDVEVIVECEAIQGLPFSDGFEANPGPN